MDLIQIQVHVLLRVEQVWGVVEQVVQEFSQQETRPFILLLCLVELLLQIVVLGKQLLVLVLPLLEVFLVHLKLFLQKTD